MGTSGDDQKSAALRPLPKDFANYQSFLLAVREFKGLRLVDVSLASQHPDWPGVKANMSALSRMENGDTKNPSFRQVIRYARGYGVSLDELSYFFLSEYARADGKQ